MTSITPYTTTAPGYADPEGSMEESSFRSSEKHAVSAMRQSSMDLSITTREGDVVTLSSDSFSEFDYLSYTSTGRVRNGHGAALSQMSYQSMTLSSGSSFTFSVDGDLNDEELDDIEAIIKGIDGVIHEMAQGDMDDAVQKALQMGGYDTVSQFEADLSLTRSYSAVSQVATQSSHGGRIPGSHDKAAQKQVGTPFGKIVELMEAKEEHLQKKALKPVGQLFDHHVNEQEQLWKDREAPGIKALSDLLTEMKQWLEELFGSQMTDR